MPVARHARITREAAPLRQQVVKLLRDDILEGNLVPGQRLRENMLCETYGVSRTVIREGLRQLESESLITVIPSQGPIVTRLTASEIRALYVVRAALEGLMGQLFALNASGRDVKAVLKHRDQLDARYRNGSIEQREAYKAEFYRLLLKGGGNAELAAMLGGIHARIALFRRFAFEDSERMRISIKELTPIYDAVAVRRDPAAAWEACEHHITLAAELAILECERRALVA